MLSNHSKQKQDHNQKRLAAKDFLREGAVCDLGIAKGNSREVVSRAFAYENNIHHNISLDERYLGGGGGTEAAVTSLTS